MTTSYLQEAINLCFAEANRWNLKDERTAQHWRDVAAHLQGDLLAKQVKQAEKES